MAAKEGAVKRPRAKRKKSPGWWKWTKLGLSVAFILGSLGFIVFGALFYKELTWAEGIVPTLNTKLSALAGKPTVILSADGKKLFEAQSEYRELIKDLDDVPEYVKDATLAAEDKRFYKHEGVDWWGAARAVVTNVREGRAAQGASTITMQLAKRMYNGPERSFSRKLKDMALAYQIEKTKTKDQILTLYLNQVFYGWGSYGIKAAAKTYFGKELNKLTLSEAALLARIVRRPSDENPFSNFEKAVENRNVVLRTMLDEAWITQKQYDDAIADVPKLQPKRFASGQHILRSPYFVQYVLDSLRQELPGIDVTQGGYRIETTINAEIDKIAYAQVKQIVNKYRRQHLTTGAFVLIDDEGRIRAMVGGVDFERNEYNMISQGKRQPGSSFKPFVYAAALSTGALGFNESISNEPFYIDDPVRGRRMWPKNSKGRYGGHVSIRTAIASSINVPAVRVCEMVGPSVAAHYARDNFGFKTPIDPVLSMPLGATSVSPLEMAEGYSVFMNRGDRVRPFGVTRVIGPDGEVVYEKGPDTRRGALSIEVCEKIDECLRAVVTGGTARKANVIEDARGKTGTTNDNRDAWFCGYANNLLGIGWVGNERREGKRWVYDPMPRVFGGIITVEIWTGVMKEAVKKLGKKKEFKESGEREPYVRVIEPDPMEEPVDDATGDDPKPPRESPEIPPIPDEVPPGETPVETSPPPVSPSGNTRPPERPRPVDRDSEEIAVEICADSGLRANRYCPETVTRRMPRSEAPRRRCNLHGP